MIYDVLKYVPKECNKCQGSRGSQIYLGTWRHKKSFHPIHPPTKSFQHLFHPPTKFKRGRNKNIHTLQDNLRFKTELTQKPLFCHHHIFKSSYCWLSDIFHIIWYGIIRSIFISPIIWYQMMIWFPHISSYAQFWYLHSESLTSDQSGGSIYTSVKSVRSIWPWNALLSRFGSSPS